MICRPPLSITFQLAGLRWRALFRNGSVEISAPGLRLIQQRLHHINRQGDWANIGPLSIHDPNAALKRVTDWAAAHARYQGEFHPANAQTLASIRQQLEQRP